MNGFIGRGRDLAELEVLVAGAPVRGEDACGATGAARSITGLVAVVLGATEIKLDFSAPGSDGRHPPPASRYLVKQSLRPIRTRHDFARARILCGGDCRFAVTNVGDTISLTITRLRPDTTYYYAIAARDNVTPQPGPHSRAVRAKTA